MDNMTAVQHLGFLVSAIRCGQEFDEHCEKSAEALRQALTAPRVPVAKPRAWAYYHKGYPDSSEVITRERWKEGFPSVWVEMPLYALAAAPAPANITLETDLIKMAGDYPGAVDWTGLPAPSPADERAKLRERVRELESYNVGLAAESQQLRAELEAAKATLSGIAAWLDSVPAVLTFCGDPDE